MAFNESMRIYPPVALFVVRECENEFKLGDITIPAGYYL
jgi:cytochrome P450